MPKLSFLYASAALLASAPAPAQVYPEAAPAARPAAGIYSPRILALGDPRFADAQLYNLYDLGGSPMGLLESHKERLAISLGYLGTHRAAPGDTLTLDHGDLAVPHLLFLQPGVFAASLYYLRESEAYRARGGDSVESHANLFGLDMAAGPASGLFRVGFSAHARLGGLDYPGEPERILLSVPSLRFDLGSRPHPALELGVFAGAGGRFDSLRTPSHDLERIAVMTVPRYGLLADVGGTEELPFMGNVVLELGTDRFLGENRPADGAGVQYPTVWTDYWTFQTQWLYPFQVQDFRLQPAARFARRSEKSQGYEGIKGNQDPFKKGDKIPGATLKRGMTDFGLGGQVGYKEMASLLLEWETSGHSYESDTTLEKRYSRFSLGLEQHIHRFPFGFPEAVTLSLREGWAWRQDAKENPGFRAFHFDPFIPSAGLGDRPGPFNPVPDSPAAYSAFTLGFSLGLMEERIGMDGYLGFPGQPERVGAGSAKASGTEFGITVGYRIR